MCNFNVGQSVFFFSFRCFLHSFLIKDPCLPVHCPSTGKPSKNTQPKNETSHDKRTFISHNIAQHRTTSVLPPSPECHPAVVPNILVLTKRKNQSLNSLPTKRPKLLHPRRLRHLYFPVNPSKRPRNKPLTPPTNSNNNPSLSCWTKPP